MIKVRKSLVVAALTAASVGLSSAAQATLLLGTTVDYQYYFPTSTTPVSFADNGNKLVGAGVEVSNIGGGFGTMDISDTNIFIDFNQFNGFNPQPFNGWKLTDLINNVPAITGVSINAATNMVGFGLSNISFTADQIVVNWTGLSFNSNTVVSLDVSAVPEPSSYAMMLAGLGVMGFVARRRKRNIA
jgi:hypothetical protein